MKYKAVFLDFYGTVVFEDNDIISEICNKISDTSRIHASPAEIGNFWWRIFVELGISSSGPSFKTLRELEQISIQETIGHFQSDADPLIISSQLFEYWKYAPIFPDSLTFLKNCQIPVYVLSNVDREDISAAIQHHKLTFSGILTSEDARSYKPNPTFYNLALSRFNLAPGSVLHVGDSYSLDVIGACNSGIDVVWLNRNNRAIPKDVSYKPTYIVSSLEDILKNGIV